MARTARKLSKRYSEKERSNLLKQAAKEGLTAAQAAEKFGVTPVTFYRWKSGWTRKAPVARQQRGTSSLRELIRTMIREELAAEFSR